MGECDEAGWWGVGTSFSPLECSLVHFPTCDVSLCQASALFLPYLPFPICDMMQHSCIEQPQPVTILITFSYENALPANADGRISACQANLSGAPTALSLSCCGRIPVISQTSFYQREGVRAAGKRVEGATTAVQSVQSSCLGRTGRAGSFPVLRLDQSSPAKPTATRVITVTIPRREARSWSYSGLGTPGCNHKHNKDSVAKS